MDVVLILIVMGVMYVAGLGVGSVWNQGTNYRRGFRSGYRLRTNSDYSPAFQDEYQRLWHESAARARTLEAERDERMTEDDYRRATQKWVDQVCHYRNLAITLGAKPEDMLSRFDRDLAEKGIADGFENEAPEVWEELEAAEERVRVLEARQAKLEAALGNVLRFPPGGLEDGSGLEDRRSEAIEAWRVGHVLLNDALRALDANTPKEDA